MGFLRRNRWPVVDRLHDFRECPDCAAIVCGDKGQQRHDKAHDELDESVFGPEIVPHPGGYVIGAGPLPASVRGGTDDELPHKMGPDAGRNGYRLGGGSSGKRHS